MTLEELLKQKEKKWIEIGVERGRAEEKKESALNLIRNTALTDEEIALNLGLAVEAIVAMREEQTVSYV